jgi:hypothetical protein
MMRDSRSRITSASASGTSPTTSPTRVTSSRSRSAGFREIDHADVGDIRHDQFRQRGDGVLVVERRRQFLSRRREERSAPLFALGRGACTLRFRRLALRFLPPCHRLARQEPHLTSQAGNEQR